jgi:hypothetical protein
VLHRKVTLLEIKVTFLEIAALQKEKASHKIDVVVALGMAAHAAVTSESSEVRITWSLATDAGTWSSADGGTFVSSLGPIDQHGGHPPSEQWERARHRIVRDGNNFYGQ